MGKFRAKVGNFGELRGKCVKKAVILGGAALEK